MSETEAKTLGELIKEKGMLKYYVRDILNKEGINCNSSTFSRWCTGKRKPQNLKARTVLAETLEVSLETINNLLKK